MAEKQAPKVRRGTRKRRVAMGGWRWVRQMVAGVVVYFVRGPEGATGTILELPWVDGTREWVKLGVAVATVPCYGGIGRLALYRLVWRQKTPPTLVAPGSLEVAVSKSRSLDPP